MHPGKPADTQKMTRQRPALPSCRTRDLSFGAGLVRPSRHERRPRKGQRVAVVGAGLAGVCTAWELAQRGCAVTGPSSAAAASRNARALPARLSPSLRRLAYCQFSPTAPAVWRWQMARQPGRGFPASGCVDGPSAWPGKPGTHMRRELSPNDESHPGFAGNWRHLQREHKALEAHASAWAELGVSRPLGEC